jgi:hypothetical protein
MMGSYNEAMKKTLIIHHIQECWTNHFRYFNRSFDELIGSLAVFSQEYDRVILTLDYKLVDPRKSIRETRKEQGFVDFEIFKYGTGWTKDDAKNNS